MFKSNHNHLISIDDIKLGDHLCSIYQNKKQQFIPLIPFLKKGIANNEKCVYIVDDNSQEEVISELKKGGIKIEKFIKSGQFVILTKRETYLQWHVFDPDKMIKFLRETEKKVLEEGYTGLRVTGEMTWVLGEDGHKTDSNKLIEYEAKLNDFFPNSKSTAICQYNENRFAPEVLTGVIHTHPLLILYGKLCENLYFYSPAQYTNKEHIAKLVDSYKLILGDILGATAI